MIPGQLVLVEDRGPARAVAVDQLVAATRRVTRFVLDEPKIKAALAAAEALPPGLVLTDEAGAVDVVDLVATIIQGEKLLAAALSEALAIPRAMEQAARQAIEVERLALSQAKARGNNARVAYQGEMRRRAAQAEAAAREKARLAAEAAAADAREAGEDEPPPMEIAPVLVPRTVAGGLGKGGTAIRVRAVAIADWTQVPQEWLELVSKAATDAFAQAGIQKPAPGESVVWRGVRYESFEHAVNRT